MRRFLLTLFALVCLPAGAFGGPSSPLVVAVTIEPQAYMVGKVAGDLVETVVMVPGGADPHTYEPKASQMRAVSDADLYVATGLEFEHAWLPKFKSANPRLTLVHADEDVDKIPMPAHGHQHGHDDHGEHDDHGRGHAEVHDEHHGERDGHGHGHAEAHDEHHGDHHDHAEHHGEHGGDHEVHSSHAHEGGDPHIWLDPKLVRRQAHSIMRGLVRLDPGNAEAYAANLKAFTAEMDALDAELRQTLDPVKGGVFMVFHPSWGYFAEAYGLTQLPIEAEGKEPGPRELAHTIEEAKEHGVRALFVQPQMSTRAAAVVAEAVGARLVTLDPLGRDLPETLRQAAAALAAVAPGGKP